MAGRGTLGQNAGVQPRGIHHVSINVNDVAKAIDFYTEVLGFSCRQDRPDLGIAGAWLEGGGQQVHLLELPPPPASGPHFAVLVDDLGATVAQLRDRGVEVSDPSPIGTSLQAFLYDPSGNQVELHQLGA